MLNLEGGDQEEIRSGDGRRGRPAMAADSLAPATSGRSHVSPRPSHRPKDGAGRATSTGKRQYWLVPVSHDALY